MTAPERSSGRQLLVGWPVLRACTREAYAPPTRFHRETHPAHPSRILADLSGSWRRVQPEYSDTAPARDLLCYAEVTMLLGRLRRQGRRVCGHCSLQ